MCGFKSHLRQSESAVATREAEYEADHLLRRGDVAGAVKRYQQTLALDPRHVRARQPRRRVRAPRAAGRRTQCYARALAIDPSAVFVRRNLALLLQSEGDLGGAIRELEAALQGKGARTPSG